jgi:chemotaxis protein histidine kinase CheA
MTDDPLSEVRGELEAIQRRFGTQLEAQVETIVDAWQDVEAGGGGSDACRRVRDLTHSLAGNAGVLGFMEVGRAATALEQLLDEALEAGLSGTTDLRSRIDTALGHLVSTAAGAARPGGAAEQPAAKRA